MKAITLVKIADHPLGELGKKPRYAIKFYKRKIGELFFDGAGYIAPNGLPTYYASNLNYGTMKIGEWRERIKILNEQIAEEEKWEESGKVNADLMRRRKEILDDFFAQSPLNGDSFVLEDSAAWEHDGFHSTHYFRTIWVSDTEDKKVSRVEKILSVTFLEGTAIMLHAYLPGTNFAKKYGADTDSKFLVEGSEMYPFKVED